MQSSGPKSVRRDGTRVTHPQAGDPPFFVCVFAPDHLELVKGPAGGRRARLDDLTATVWPARRARPARAYAKALAQRNALLGRVRARAVARRLAARVGPGAGAPRHRADGAPPRAGRGAGGAISPTVRRSSACRSPCDDRLPAAQLGAHAPRSWRRSCASASTPISSAASRCTARTATTSCCVPARRDLRRYGSQGQQRLGLLALLLAERDVLRDRPRHESGDAARRRAQRARPRPPGAVCSARSPIRGQTLISTADARTVPDDAAVVRLPVRPAAPAWPTR